MPHEAPPAILQDREGPSIPRASPRGHSCYPSNRVNIHSSNRTPPAGDPHPHNANNHPPFRPSCTDQLNRHCDTRHSPPANCPCSAANSTPPHPSPNSDVSRLCLLPSLQPLCHTKSARTHQTCTTHKTLPHPTHAPRNRRPQGKTHSSYPHRRSHCRIPLPHSNHATVPQHPPGLHCLRYAARSTLPDCPHQDC